MTNEEFLQLLTSLTDQELETVLDGMPEPAARALLNTIPTKGLALPKTPLHQAQDIDDGYRNRPHLDYLSDRLAQAVTDVEQGTDRRIVISMPPRSGKSFLTSQFLPLWLLRRHPEWKVGMISHDVTLSVSWARGVRRLIDTHPELGIKIAPDAGAAAEWETTSGGGILSRSVGGAITGRGFKALIMDDVVKDFVAAHSQTQRQSVWDWWTSTASTRLEPPSLVIAIGTRWHEDDYIGRLLSHDTDGDPDLWEEIRFPALAETGDVLGRSPGQPLLSPLIDETEEEALARWATVKRSVGSYTWAALYQQRPAPATGAIFDMAWMRYWTTDPGKVTDDGKVVLLNPNDHSGNWCESWDCAFKGTQTSDFVVGQRWVRRGPNLYLTDQTRGRWSFTQTLQHMRAFAADHVPARLVEDKANGTAVLDTMRRELGGLIPVTPRDGKEARARSVTPAFEAGNVYLPHPTEHPWVSDLLDEMRSFPTGVHDDQVDALTQALNRLTRSSGTARAGAPGLTSRRIPGRPTPRPGQLAAR